MSPAKRKVLILGKSGMLGHMVFKVLSHEPSFVVTGTQMESKKRKDYFNVLDGLKGLERLINKYKGLAYIINCIGLTKNKINEEGPFSVAHAVQINTLFPRALAVVARKHGIRVIHMSTDGVFRGRGLKYSEDSLCDSKDLYGRTKILGEVLSKNVINIRCSLIGPSPMEKGGLYEWFKGQPEGARLSGFTNHIWQGVTTLQFAGLCQRIIKYDLFDRLRKSSGVLHFSPNKPVSKHELLCLLRENLRKKVTIKPVKHRETVRRVLVSKNPVLKKIFPRQQAMRKAIEDLMRSET